MKTFILITLLNCFTFQKKSRTILIVDKGIYIEITNNDQCVTVPQKEGLDIVLFLKNDSIAIVKEIQKGQPAISNDYKVSQKIDTAYVRSYSIINGKKKLSGTKKVLYHKAEPLKQ